MFLPESLKNESIFHPGVQAHHLFLVKFIGIYLVGNLLYGFYITSYYPGPDPVTRWISSQSAFLINVLGWSTQLVDMTTRPTTFLNYQHRAIISVYEGCNGINVMVIFVAFIVGFGPLTKKIFWFIPLGLVLIHLSNLLRIVLLFFVTLYLPDVLYFAHKYLFTAFIYLIVLLLWVWWVRKIGSFGKK